jgi:hypothetical protein
LRAFRRLQTTPRRRPSERNGRFNVFENPHSELVDRDPLPLARATESSLLMDISGHFFQGKATKGAG